MRVVYANTGNSIEDNVVVTKNGSKNLTTVAKDPEEMEKMISTSS
jgi:Xaa-Pro aminopeptidase